MYYRSTDIISAEVREAMAEYRPTPEVAQILEWALGVVQSVPYEVTARWLFYRGLQRYGLGGKGSYKKFLKWTSRARKAFWNGWAPDTLTDDTRTITRLGDGYESEAEWIESMKDREPVLNARSRQKNIVLVLFEAAAMSSQFDYCLAPLRVSMAPFKGDASIPHKWDIARWLTRQHERWIEKPIVILYFGDLDPKGLEIPTNALRDIWKWMEAPDLGDRLVSDGPYSWTTPDGRFRWIRCGILPEQVQELSIPENPDKPGTYQWEALDDLQARTLILESVRRWWDPSVIEEIRREEEAAGRRWREFCDRLAGMEGG